jgi:hypothetical protein
MTRREFFSFFIALATVLLSLSALASLVWSEEDNDDYEGTMAQLDQAYALYDKGKYKKARALVDKLKKKVFENSETGGLEYPTSITLNLKLLDNRLMDREGYFNRLPSITGIARVLYDGNTGMFEVKGKQETLTFIYHRDVLIVGDSGFAGRRITVYYHGLSPFESSNTALKIVVHPKKRR